MPNFLATRETHSFQDRPNGVFAHRPLHLVGQTTATVIYRNGHEVEASAEKGKKDSSRAKGQVAGLVTSGEFGPILAVVLTDAARSKLAWSHWESGPGGPLSVFAYEVPRTQSHYQVRLGVDSHFLSGDSQYSAYHGELAIDSLTGAILRLTALADRDPEDPVVMASIMVEYGPVDIGGKTYICPVRSVALAQRPQAELAMGAVPSRAVKQARLTTLLNEVEFKQYHIFRGDSRILTAEEAEQAPGAHTDAQMEAQPVPGADIKPDASTEPGASSPSEAPQPPPRATPAEPAHASERQPAIDAPVAASAPLSAEQPAPGAIPHSTPSADIPSGPLFKSTTREVVVDVVVTGNRNDPITGLRKQDFAITEDGKPQAIDFFEEHAANLPAVGSLPAMPPMRSGMRTNVPPPAITDSVNVLLLDTLNTEQQEQAYVHSQIMEFLKKMRPGTRVAIFALGSKLRFVQGFTTDTAALSAAINDKRNGFKEGKNPVFRSRFDDVADAAEIGKLQALEVAPFAIAAIQRMEADSAVHDYGARAAMTFEALLYLGHYLAGVPGRKNLIWFDSSYPVIIFPTAEQRERLQKNSTQAGYLEQVRQTADLFTLSKIAVYPIGAQGVTEDHVLEANSAGPGGAAPGNISSHPDANMDPYMAGAAARIDTIFAMEQLAASTGGKAFYNTNDINGAIESAINDGAQYYTLGYSPVDRKMDGGYRRIDVKVTTGKYKLAYRRGYNADQGPPSDANSGGNPLAPLLVFGLPPASGVLYGVQAAPSTPQPAPDAALAGDNPRLKRPLTRYRVDFVLRAEDVILKLNPQGGRTGRILVGLKAYGGDGNAVNWQQSMETLNVNAAAYESVQKTGIPAHFEIDLPANTALHLVTAVYDWNSGKAGSLEIPLPAAPPAASTK